MTKQLTIEEIMRIEYGCDMTPIIGMPVTIGSGIDLLPAVIDQIKNKRTCIIKLDVPEVDRQRMTITRKRDGYWQVAGKKWIMIKLGKSEDNMNRPM